uniref:Putative tRNA-i(6)A37 thiotransferase enzyme MiaB n=1 Tax=mine drainage metagenome TaxID=410659 RepID=E6QTL7_9ZZZZ
MNAYDSDKMADVLRESEGMTPTDDPLDADVILFNTCSVREKAQEKVFSDLGRVRELKDLKPDLIIGVGGCVASQEGEAIFKRAPYVDVIFGPQTLHRLPDLIARRRATGQSQCDISFPEIEKFDQLPVTQTKGVTAFVSIMEGCSKYCTFCVVPYTRGEEVSRPFDDILAEIASLTAQGVKEITLLGQNVNAYRGLLSDGEQADFALLLEYVHEIPGVERIRFTTSHPRECTQRMIDAYARLPKLAAHLHLPVQCGSDRILAAMKRGYSVLEYKSVVRRLREARPNLSISSDFIVGFPGETEVDFAGTLQLIADVGFDISYCFLYSPRPGTPAAELKDDVDLAQKQSRLLQVQAALHQGVITVSEQMLNTVQRVLVENVSKRDERELIGRSTNNRVINFMGDKSLIGQFIEVRITATNAHWLHGERLL